MDTSDGRPRIEFVRDLEPALVDLYAAGLALRDVEPEDDSAPPEALTFDEAAALQRRLWELLGDLDYYSLVFDPYEPEAPVAGS